MSPEFQEFIRLAPLGVLVGAYGTLVGAGGGSVLVPILLILLPQETSATVTAISLAVVFFNAYSGTIAYVRMGRIVVTDTKFPRDGRFLEEIGYWDPSKEPVSA